MSGEGKEQHTWPVRRRTGATDNNLNILYDPDSNHVLRERAGTGNGAYRKDYVLDVVRDRVLGVVGGGSASGGVFASTTYWYQNFRGDVRAVGNGLNTDTRSYLPTGVAVAGSADAVDFPDVRYGFQGKEVQTTGLADFENRFYAAHQGRFGSRDPLGLGVVVSQTHENSNRTNTEAFLDFRTQADYSLRVGAVDRSGLYSIKTTNPKKCDSTQRWYINNSMWYVDQAIRSTCMKSDVLSSMDRQYDAADIKCPDSDDYCGMAASVNNVLLYRGVFRTNRDCNKGAFTEAEYKQWHKSWTTGEIIKRKLRRVLFHEMLHNSRLDGPETGKLNHMIISTCTFKCRNYLSLPSFTLGADTLAIYGESGLYTSQCSKSGK